MSLPDVFSSKFKISEDLFYEETPCWEWTAYITEKGYGRIFYNRKLKFAHRFAYTWLVGQIPEGMQLDHLCRVRHCVNPAHLEPVTHYVNQRRGNGNINKTHCKRGHEFTPENTAITNKGKSRRCRICKNAQERTYYHNKK